MSNAGRKSAWTEKIEPRLEEITAWARDGYTDKEICNALDIHISTFCKYKLEKTELTEALKISKDIADLRVEDSLYKRAIGYDYEERTIKGVFNEDGKPLGMYEEKITTKHLPPDPTSAFFWLQNRSNGKWRSTRHLEITGKDGGPVETRRLNKKDYIKIREQMLKNNDC